MNAQDVYQPWLLAAEPDLTPDQVWLVLATASHEGGNIFREWVVIADTADQAMTADEEWTPLVAINETALDAQVAEGEAAPVYVAKNIFGKTGTQRFALVFASDDVQTPIRLRWVAGDNATIAKHAWRHFGETMEPSAVLSLSSLVELRDLVRRVRHNRGGGATSDKRRIDHPEERWTAIVKERMGPEVYEETRRKLAEKMAIYHAEAKDKAVDPSGSGSAP